jgi:hypothetical protein
MLAPMIVIELVVCLAVMLLGWLLDEAHAWFVPSRESSRCSDRRAGSWQGHHPTKTRDVVHRRAFRSPQAISSEQG